MCGEGVSLHSFQLCAVAVVHSCLTPNADTADASHRGLSLAISMSIRTHP